MKGVFIDVDATKTRRREIGRNGKERFPARNISPARNPQYGSRCLIASNVGNPGLCVRDAELLNRLPQRSFGIASGSKAQGCAVITCN